MKYIIISLFLFASVIVLHSQEKISYDYKIIYKLDYKPGINLDNRDNEYFSLYTNDLGSEFSSIGKRALDSITINKDSSLSLGQFKSLVPEYKFEYVLYYDYYKKTLTMTQSFINVGIGYKENASLQWRLTGEKQKIKGYQCQKAVLDYEGRTYVAWFTLDIPIQDGPYKFKGLPGLIIQIKDVENEFQFDLISLKKLNPKPISFYHLKDFDLTKKKKFREIRKNFSENPFAMYSQSGIKIDIGPEEKARMLEEQKQTLLKTNNTIERY